MKNKNWFVKDDFLRGILSGIITLCGFTLVILFLHFNPVIVQGTGGFYTIMNILFSIVFLVVIQIPIYKILHPENRINYLLGFITPGFTFLLLLWIVSWSLTLFFN